MLLPKKDMAGDFPLSGWLPNIPYITPAIIQLKEYIYPNVYSEQDILKGKRHTCVYDYGEVELIGYTCQNRFCRISSCPFR